MTDAAAEMRTDEPRWLDDREQQVWRGYLELHSRLMARLNRELQGAAGISLADYAVLAQISEDPTGRLRVLELARTLRWEKSRVSHQLRRMQQRDLIQREGCEVDRRGSWVRLTPLGTRTLDRAAAIHVDGVRRYLFDALDPGAVDALGTIVATALARFGESPDDPDETAVEPAC